MHIKKHIKVISIASEIIWISLIIVSDYIFTVTVAVFWIISDFPIHLMHFISKLQTPITFLLVNENIKCGYAFS